MKQALLNKFTEDAKLGKKHFSILIDPDRTDPEQLELIANEAQNALVDWILIGSSLLVKGSVDQTIRILKDSCDIPVVLFPGNPSHISPFADGILLLSLISGRNPELLIGNHVVAAPAIEKSGIEVMPTGYMLVDGGAYTSVQYISNTLPIPKNKNEIAVSTALAGQQLGLKCIYMEAGSGAKEPVPSSMINQVRNELSIPVIVGGGIRNVDTAINACDAGADMVIVGSAIEKTEGKGSLIREISEAIRKCAQ